MSLIIIGAGLPRTGTGSLQLALEHLGFGPCYHMKVLVNDPAKIKPWIDAYDGLPIEWGAVFEGYKSTVDTPGSPLYASLAERYPAAKLILSVRDPTEWYDSFIGTVAGPGFARKLSTSNLPDLMKRIGNRMGWNRFTHPIDRFEAHNAEVRQTIAPDRLLTFDVKDGWLPLCEFLGAPVPNTPFPHEHDRRHTPQTPHSPTKYTYPQ